MYTIMHDNIPVIDIEIDEVTGSIIKTKDILSKDRIPVGVRVLKENMDRGDLNGWWESRIIPITRQDYSSKISEIDIANAKILALKGNALSLSDHYWIKNASEDMNWRDINFYENPFSDNVGDFFCMGKKIDDIDFRSPDSTSGGWLKKKWERGDKSTFLLKGSSAPFYQEAANEFAISNAYKSVGYEHYLPYSIEHISIKEKPEVFSKCENMTDIHTELVKAYQFYTEERKPNHISVFDHLVNQAVKHGMDIDHFLRHEILMDYITNNKDRHLNNIAFIRNTDNLEYVGVAPVYDSGTSLWYDTVDGNISGTTKESAKPFASSQQEQMEKYITGEFLATISMADYRIIPEVIDESLRRAGVEPARAGRIARASHVRYETIFKDREIKKEYHDMGLPSNIFSTEEDIAKTFTGMDHIDEYVAEYKAKKASERDVKMEPDR